MPGLACLHIAAFSEITVIQYDPANLWANFGYTVSIGAGPVHPVLTLTGPFHYER